MQTIGERMAEARKRLGISLREASEATRIRSDFLSAMEDNSMNIPLPEVYRRGFVKIYALYLKLDAEKLLTDYDAVRLAEHQKAHHHHRREGHREFLGRIEMPEKEKAKSQTKTTAPEEPFDPEDDRDDRSWKDTIVDNVLENRDLYLKVGAGVGAVVLVLLLVMLFMALITGEGGEATPSSPPREESPASVSTLQPVEPENVRLIATGDVASVIVTQLYNNEQLFAGSMAQGEDFEFEKRGRIRIQYSAGENLLVEIDGQGYRLGRSGIGRTTLD